MRSVEGTFERLKTQQTISKIQGGPAPTTIQVKLHFDFTKASEIAHESYLKIDLNFLMFYFWMYVNEFLLFPYRLFVSIANISTRSKEVYESCLTTPLAPELNTSRSFKMMSRPKVIKTIGAPIPTPQPSRKFTKVDSVQNQLNRVVNPLSSLAGRKGIVLKQSSAKA